MNSRLLETELRERLGIQRPSMWALPIGRSELLRMARRP